MEKDWEKLIDSLFNSLPSRKNNQRKWTVDEIKAQVGKMKLEPSRIIAANKTKNSAVKHIVCSSNKNKLPQKGTILREKLKDEVMQKIFVRSRSDTQLEINNGSDDLEELLHEQVGVIDLVTI